MTDIPTHLSWKLRASHIALILLVSPTSVTRIHTPELLTHRSATESRRVGGGKNKRNIRGEPPQTEAGPRQWHRSDRKTLDLLK